MPTRTAVPPYFLRLIMIASALLCSSVYWLYTNNRLTQEYRNDIQIIHASLEQKYQDLGDLNSESAYTSMDNPRVNNFKFLILEVERHRNIIREIKMRCIEVEPQNGAASDIREVIVDTIILEQKMADALHAKLQAQSRLVDIKHKLHNDDQDLSTHYTRSYIELQHKEIANQMSLRDAALEQFNNLGAQARRNLNRTRELLAVNTEASPIEL